MKKQLRVRRDTLRFVYDQLHHKQQQMWQNRKRVCNAKEKLDRKVAVCDRRQESLKVRYDDSRSGKIVKIVM